MALPIYRKIKLFASKVVTDYIALNDTNDYNIATLGTDYPAEQTGYGTNWTDPGLNNNNTSTGNAADNHYKDMFDGNYNTKWRFYTGYTIAGATDGQLIYDFGRKIKPRQFKIIYGDSSNTLDFKLYFVNKNPNIEQADLVTGDSVTEEGVNYNVNADDQVDNIGVDDDNDGVFRDTDAEGNDMDFTTVTLTGQDVDGDDVEVTGLRQCVLKKDFFTNGTYDNYQYMVIKFNSPGGLDSGYVPSFYCDIVQIEIHEEVEVRDFSYEFDDSLLGLKTWINPRYEGCKIKQKRLNYYSSGSTTEATPVGEAELEVSFQIAEQTEWEGDTTGPFGLEAMTSNRTTALYYATTIIGGEEDPQFATLKGHSYVQIQKVFIIDKEDLSVTIFDRDAVGGDVGSITNSGFESFNRFITNDFPTGGRLNLQILDGSVESVLKPEYHCKMNKGWLLKSFDFNYQPTEGIDENTLYFYSGSVKYKNRYVEQRNVVDDEEFTQFGCTDAEIEAQTCEPGIHYPPKDQIGLRFRYALNGSDPAVDVSFGTAAIGDWATGGLFDLSKSGPSFASSSIIQNKFTEQYYSGSFGFVLDRSHMQIDDPDNPSQLIYFGGGANANTSEKYRNSSIGSASRFIGMDTLNWYFNTGYPNTELHITFLDGTKDFAPGYNDERSIGTFEVSPNQGALELGDVCNGGQFFNNGDAIPGSGLPKHHEIILKGNRDTRFEPTIETFPEAMLSSFLNTLHGIGAPVTVNHAEGGENYTTGCAPDSWTDVFNEEFNHPIGNGDWITNMACYIQGGKFGPKGKLLWAGAGENVITPDNTYQGDFNWEMSFLDKDHVIIIDLNKHQEMFEGIGDQGVLIIPEHLDRDLRDNLETIKQQLSTLLGYGGTSDSAINIT